MKLTESIMNNLNESVGSSEIVSKIDDYFSWKKLYDEYKSIGSSDYLPFIVLVQQNENIATGFENFEKNFYSYIDNVLYYYAKDHSIQSGSQLYDAIKHILQTWEDSSDKEEVNSQDLLKRL